MQAFENTSNELKHNVRKVYVNWLYPENKNSLKHLN